MDYTQISKGFTYTDFRHAVFAMQKHGPFEPLVSSRIKFVSDYTIVPPYIFPEPHNLTSEGVLWSYLLPCIAYSPLYSSTSRVPPKALFWGLGVSGGSEL